MKHLIKSFIFATMICLAFVANGASGSDTKEVSESECSSGQSKNSSAKVFINLQNRCMCFDGSCFKVGIGKDGPEMTSSGTGILKGCEGAKYQKTAKASTSYDKDCFATGISQNDHVGKWLHKPRGCHSVASGPQASKGCVLVPCSKWAELRDYVEGGNVQLQIVGSAVARGGYIGSAQRHSAESADDYDIPEDSAAPGTDSGTDGGTQ